MRARLRAFAAACYAFVVGADPRLALAVVAALVLTALAAATTSLPARVITPAVLAAVLVYSTARARPGG
jgi:uncharacterized membrane protein (UPF0136 family)